MTASSKKILGIHEWIGYKFKESGGNAQTTKFLEKLYPNEAQMK